MQMSRSQRLVTWCYVTRINQSKYGTSSFAIYVSRTVQHNFMYRPSLFNSKVQKSLAIYEPVCLTSHVHISSEKQIGSWSLNISIVYAVKMVEIRGGAPSNTRPIAYNHKHAVDRFSRIWQFPSIAGQSLFTPNASRDITNGTAE